MPILKNKKLIFVHIPKTGGQSIEAALGIITKEDQLFGLFHGREYSHLTAKEILSIVGRSVFNSCFKFAIVRNPFDRLVSEYFFKKKGGDCRFIDIWHVSSFKDFIHQLKKKHHEMFTTPQIEINHFLPQTNFVYSETDNLLVDKIFKFEDFANEIKDFIEQLGYSLPHVNQTTHKHYRHYFDRETQAIVETIYSDDLKRFDYAF
jgi:hypothetical protein